MNNAAEKKDLFDTELFKQTKVTTLDELENFYARLEKLLSAEGEDVWFYDLYAAMAQKNAEFLANYGKTEEEINALIAEEGFDECSEPYVKLCRELGERYENIGDHYSKHLFSICRSNFDEAAEKDISDFVTRFSLLVSEAETTDEPCVSVAGKAVPYRWVRQRFAEFDADAWKRVYRKYCEEWSPAKTAESKIRYIPEYSAGDKMLAYYLLDFWYERTV